jgi:small subunit ribosomal protein S16
MRQQGANSRQTFRIVVTDKRSPRDGGRYVAKLGWYQPFAPAGKNCFLDVEGFQHWVNHGAQVSDRVQSLVASLAPDVIKEMTAKRVAKRVKARLKRKKK